MRAHTFEASVHRRAQWALRWMQGMVSMAANRRAFSSGSRMYVSINSEYLRASVRRGGGRGAVGSQEREEQK